MNRIKELRKDNGLSVRACAMAAGLTPSTLLRIEKGERKVSSVQAIALANYFGVTIEYILECDNEQKATAHPNRLRELRKAKGWTQQQLADKVGLRDSTVRMWELGKSEPRGKTIKQLAELFGVTTDYILEYNNEKKTTAHPNRLRELREAKGLTTEELGKAIGLDASMITHIERGDKNFSIDSLIRACDYFGVTTDYMLCRGEENTDA